ncbi:MAG: hypothetical protein VR78_04105 [Hoeflea sp. BRH_c9]|nr:MAG: hypothetical protein VR78_04105 [Hoeflea sp. BRH_c9]
MTNGVDRLSMRSSGKGLAAKVRPSLFSGTALPVLALSLFMAPASAQTVWDGDTDTEFSTNTNWVGDVAPGALDEVDINNAGLGNQPVVTGAELVDIVNLSDGSLTIDVAGSLTVANTFNLSATGILNGPGIVTATTTSISGGTVSAGAVLSGDHTITGGVINGTLNGGNFDVNVGAPMTIGGLLEGGGQLTLTGGALTLTNANTYSGGTTVASGTLRLEANTAAGTGTITTTGSVIDYANGVNVANPININSNTTQLQVLVGTATQTGVISETAGPRPLEKIGAGTLVLAGANTYTGATTLTAGTLQTGASERIADASDLIVNGGVFDLQDLTETVANLSGTGGAINIDIFGSLTVTQTANQTFAGNFTGSSLLFDNAIVKNGAGTLTLTGTNSMTGAGSVRINAGRIQVSGGNALGDNQLVTGAGTLELLGNETIGTMSVGLGVELNGNTLTLAGEGSGTVILATHTGIISGTGNIVVGVGNDTQAFSGANTYTGSTTINGGTLQAVNASALGVNGPVTVNAGGTLFLSSNLNIGSLAGAGAVTLGANTLTTGGNNTSTTHSGLISGAGALVKTGTGTLTLSTDNTYSGGTTVAGGTLSLGSDAAAGTGTITTTGSVIDYANGVNIANLININSNTTQLQVLVGTATQSGIISETAGPRPLEKIGAGTLVLAAANTYTGATTVTAGTLQMGANERIADTSDLIVNGGTFDVQGFDETVANLSGTGGAINILAGGSLTVTQTANQTFAGDFTGATNILGSAIVKNGGGTLTLTGTNSMTGAGVVSINAGTLQVSGGNAIGDNQIVTGPGTFELLGNETIGLLSSGVGVDLNGNTLTLAGDGSGVLVGAGHTGIISGTGNIIVNIGNDNQTFTGANTYSGSTTIDSGTVFANNLSALGNNGAVTVNAGGTLDVQANLNIGSLAGAGAVALNAGTLTTGGDNTSTTFSGIATGTDGLTKTGTGTQTLTGVNTYTGATTVSGGTLALTGAGSLDSTNIDINNGGTLQTDGGALETGSDIDVAAGGTLDVNGSENLGAASTLDLNGAGATVDIAAGQTLSVGTITTADGSIVTINAGATLAGLSNTINNGGVMNVVDTGSVIDVGAINNLATGVINFAGAATFDSDTDNAGAEPITNDGQINLNGTNVQIVNVGPTGNNDLINQGAGEINVNAGRLDVAGTLTNSSPGAAVGGVGGLDIALGGILNTAALVNNAGGEVTNAGTLTSTAVVANNAGATFENTGTLNSGLTNAGTFTNEAGGVAGAVTNSGTGSNAGTIASLDNSGTFGNTATITGNASNTAGTTTNTGSVGGTLNVSGGTFNHNTGGSVAGDTTITGGTLNVNGTATLSSATVNVNGGTLNTDGGGLSAAATLNVAGGTLASTGAETVSIINLSAGAIAAGTFNAATFAQTGGTNSGTINAPTQVVAIGGAIPTIGAGGVAANNASANGITVTTSAGGAISNAAGDGIALANSTGGNVQVTLGANVTGTGGDGINITSTGGGTVTVAGNGDVTGGNGAGNDGIDITADGTTLVSVNGAILGDPGVLFNSAAGASFTLNGVGDVTGVGDEGVLANTTGGNGDLLINRDGAILGTTTGVDARSSNAGAGTGTVTVTSFAGQSITGTTGAGVITRTDLGLNTVNGAGSISGATFGVDAQSLGGDITVNGSGSVTGTAAAGISATSTGGNGNVTVTKTAAGATVTGGADGIIATTTGTGAIDVAVANNVTGTSTDGIRLGSGTGAVALAITGAGTTITGGANAVNFTGGVLTGTNAGTITSAGNALNFSSLGSGTFTNTNIATGDIQTAAGVTSAIINTSGTWTLNTGNSSSLLGGADAINNSGTFNMNGNALSGVEAFTNTGTINALGASSIGGGVVTNTGGTISLADGATDDFLTMNGNVANGGGGTYNLDLALTNAATGLVDRIAVNGSLSGTVNVNFTPTVVSTRDTPGDTLVISSTDNSGSAVGTVTGLISGPFVQYNLVDSGNDYVIRTTLNLGTLGGLVGSLSSVQNIVNSAVNRPTSAFVATPIGVEPDTCAPGVYGRMTGGTSTASATTSSPLSASASSEVDVNYGGFQTGVDYGCFNIGGDGASVNLGLLGGVSLGTASQNQNLISSSNRFTSRNVGAYATYSKGRFFADIQTVFDWTRFKINSTANGQLFVQDDKFDTRRFTVSGSMGYAFAFDDVSVVPTTGFSYSRTSADNVTIDAAPGGTLQFNDVENMIGFASLSVAKTYILPNETSALQPFVTATIYNDFAKDPVVNYIAPSGAVTPTSTTNFGTYGELSAGVNYRNILDAENGSLREVSASIRGDVTFNKDLLGGRITANLRLQF